MLTLGGGNEGYFFVKFLFGKQQFDKSGWAEDNLVMDNITLALAVLLGVGFLAAKIGQMLRLPSVTGYILAGLLLGPSVLNFLPAETSGSQLAHFTQIALMMIAFGIGEHLEIKRLRASIRSVTIIAVAEVFGAFLFVGCGTFVVGWLTGIGGGDWLPIDYVFLSVLLGAVSVATAPATTMHVMKELRASGPLTTTLMAVVAMDNGLALMIFGISIAVARQMLAAGSGSLFVTVPASLFEIGGSLLMGIVTGLLIDFITNRLRRDNEMLTVGLALLLLCGEGARYLHMSPLLAGMAAGFTIVNRDHRDMRLFRAMNDFEPPIYVLFFALAGVSLHISALAVAGWLGLAYFVLRTTGKIVGAGIGARLSRAPETVRRYFGMALIPQAGVAIGLVFLMNDDPSIRRFSEVITPVVLAGVVLSEIVGPLLARRAVKMAGEAVELDAQPRYNPLPEMVGEKEAREPAGVPMMPWVWKPLSRPLRPQGVVLFGANHLATGVALARMAAIFAHYYDAFPMAARVIPLKGAYEAAQSEADKILMTAARTEVQIMGSELYTVARQSDDVARTILDIARQSKTWGIVLGHSLQITPSDFQKVIGEIVELAPCPTLVIKFSGVLHTERILVPFVDMGELQQLADPVKALAAVGHHRITFLQLMSTYESTEEVLRAEENLRRWAEAEELEQVSTCRAVATEARQASILDASENHDIVIMAGPKSQGIQRLLFGSLAIGVAQHCRKTLITVFSPAR